MQNYKYRLSATAMLLATIASIGYLSNSVNAIPAGLFKDHYIFGPLVGVTTNDTGEVDWILTGIWRSSLTNDTNYNTNTNDTQENQTAGTFNAAIEMIKPDGTARHTHTITDFVVTISSQDTQNNSTILNGTSTISLREGPAVHIPTTIQKSNNDNVFKILVDPESVDYHFGKSPLIYGISNNHDLMKKPSKELMH
ncbi:MAG: hypothetical protein P0116_11330 [Candidatus Nitrosocosmicus sp.]|nr:hypothetical protein [Candidatus Nitrosocosmicus sp.]